MGRLASSITLAAIFLALEWAVLAYCGISPRVIYGAAIGTFAGLGCLVLEMALIGRSMRRFNNLGVQATLQTFTLRLVVVGSLGTLFLGSTSPVDVQAFAVTYLVTFFVYMCWLTWRTAMAPVQYKGSQGGQARVVRRGHRVRVRRVA